MAEISHLSRVDNANVDQAKLGQPEGMARSNSNNRVRELAGALRRWYEHGEWVDLLLEQGGPTYTIALLNPTTTRITASTPTEDHRLKFPIGRRLRFRPSLVEGIVTAVSHNIGTGQVDVTCSFPRIARVEVEAGTSGDGTGGSPANITLGFLNVTPGTVRITDSVVHAGINAITDNGAGILVHPSDGNVGTINYATGAVVVNALSVAFDADATINYDTQDVTPASGEGIDCYFLTSLGDAAFRETGTSPGQVPLAEDFGAAAFLEPGPGNDLDADTLDGYEATEIFEASAESARQLLVNPAFTQWPLGRMFTSATFFPNNDAQMTACQWRLLSQNNNRWEVHRNPALDASAPTAPAPIAYNALVLQASAANPAPPNSERGGICQYLENREARLLAGKTVSFSIYARKTGTVDAFRMAVLTWTGAIDGPAADPISNWNTPGTNPTLVANWAYTESGAKVPTGSWVRFALENVALPANLVNLAVFVWVDTAQSNPGDQLWLSGAQLEIGTVATALRPPRWADDFNRCNRFARSTFWKSTVAGQNLGAGTGEVYANEIFSELFPVQLFRAPTVTTFNPLAANANWASGNVPTVGSDYHQLNIRGGGSADSIHFTADAGF